ncbi:sugar ABC transporter substrate-binding protein [Rhodobacter veldkampii DSM 11550]|uniref:Sugar ABC transporter substrate-binding protein n=1 Tax=Phaeovulum veldkampii DSM 11550 TaxID=1185920 RepID=A0A2T4JLZ4_9RHOB|nr:polysaccharide biosynthesis/export family protein [Phaeovulum veldkampii]MBK5945963.1 sugar ABC transporter substrate-binding protein [Phaeovulum veldkampii DSM 11550]PTE18914.1 sugar ABC transporter substrate-binding protein [Phaeovulum veldkampii DSM 11550]TDQ64642.1 polysaccharide export outer membrane protein [Phaeovulum veldkampii DSM 11550]
MNTRLGLVLVASALLASCSSGHVQFPVTRSAQQNLPPDVQVIRLDAGNIQSFTKAVEQPAATALPQLRNWDYRIGVGDVLSIIVFDHPELTLPAGPGRSAEETGFRVQADGTINYPFVGQVPAKGKAPEDVREDLRTRLADFIPDPQLEVRVATFNSQAVTVTGAVGSPNRQPLTTVPLRLLDAVNAAGGLTEMADGRQVTVKRNGVSYRVDLEGFLAGGINSNNPILLPGDVVTVPRRRASEAYLLGQIVKPATIDLSVETVTLTQALTRQGGLLERRADARGVFVFRANGVPGMKVFQLDASSPTALLLGTRFVLQPNDVVYVTRAPLSRWNDTISDILPSINVVENLDDVATN